MRFWILREGKKIPVDVEERHGGYAVTLDGAAYEVGSACILDGLYSLIVQGQSYEVTVHSPEPGAYDVHMYDGMRRVELVSPLELILRSEGERTTGHGGSIRAPMPGKVVKVLVREGQLVTKGSGVVVLEAMKMQNELQAPVDGVVSGVRVKEGDSVVSGAELVTFGNPGGGVP